MSWSSLFIIPVSSLNIPFGLIRSPSIQHVGEARDQYSSFVQSVCQCKLKEVKRLLLRFMKTRSACGCHCSEQKCEAERDRQWLLRPLHATVVHYFHMKFAIILASLTWGCRCYFLLWYHLKFQICTFSLNPCDMISRGGLRNEYMTGAIPSDGRGAVHHYG